MFAVLAPNGLAAQETGDTVARQASPLSAQSDTVRWLARKAGLSLNYDKIEGRIAIRGDDWEVKSGAFSLGPTIQMRIICVVDGDVLDPAAMRCGLGFHASSGIDWAFRSDPEVTLLADDSIRLRLGQSHETDFDARSGIRAQWVMVDLPIEDVVSLAGAHEVLGKIGRHQVKLNGQHLKELRGLAALLSLASGR
jgi:hypothetical protein